LDVLCQPAGEAGFEQENPRDIRGSVIGHLRQCGVMGAFASRGKAPGTCPRRDE
jgi:hypothetical protein